MAFGTYTEFYCQNGGSNLNAGSTTNNTAAYTSIHGNWTQTTGVFTPTDSSTPASTVNVGDWASVYIDGASVGVYIGRVSAVGAGTNGAITANTNGIGSKPANQTGTATIKVGGALQGPNGASGYPITLASWGNNKDASSNLVRLNMKNDQTYSLTASIAVNNAGGAYVVQGYSSSVGDGGKATWDGSTSTGQIFTQMGPTGTLWIDHIFKTSISSGTADLVTTSSQQFGIYRCVFTGSRGHGLNANSTTGTVLSECEAYGNNTSNTASKAGFAITSSANILRCYSHDNTGSNTAGFLISSSGVTITNSISDTNGGIGISFTGTSSAAPNVVANCDVYNNGSDGIKVGSSAAISLWIENTNLIKNTGAGINNTTSTVSGFVYNCGYGAGTQANGSSDTLGNLTKTGTVTYESNVTPWSAPTTGNFTIVTTSTILGINAGRGAFQENDGTNTGTVGYPDIGAANHLDTGDTPTHKEAQAAFAQ